MKQRQKNSQHLWHVRKTHTTPISSWWQQPVIGYSAACLSIAIGIGITLLDAFFALHVYFSVSSLLLAILLVSLFWGTGPGILASLLGSMAFSYFVDRSLVEPNALALDWTFFSRLLPFALTSLFIAAIAGQNQIARRLLQQRANELSDINHELEQANRLKDYFMVRAAHELRTPLTALLGETQLALRRLHKVGYTMMDCQSSFEKVETRAIYLRTLVENLLELSCWHSDEMHLRPSVCDFEKLCRKVIEDQQALSGRQITYQYAAQPLIFQADCERLSQVVHNLLENAIHYSLEHTVIEVHVNADQTSVLLQVHNEGPELSSEQQKLIFEPFYRTSLAEDIFQARWGLGLTISQEIVEKHHGHIWVEPEESNGTTVCVRIPYSKFPLEATS